MSSYWSEVRKTASAIITRCLSSLVTIIDEAVIYAGVVGIEDAGYNRDSTTEGFLRALFARHYLEWSQVTKNR